MPRPRSFGTWGSRSSPDPSTGRGGTGPSTSSTRTASPSSSRRRFRASCPAMAEATDDPVARILAYHEATKHSPESVRRRFHPLDWDNKPNPFKVYLGLERVPIPEDVPSVRVPALEAIGVAEVR